MTAERIPIGTFSRVTRLSQRALRLYDERGLLVPADGTSAPGTDRTPPTRSAVA
jgi:DNA-binding transcriptional MerR regulator